MAYPCLSERFQLPERDRKDQQSDYTPFSYEANVAKQVAQWALWKTAPFVISVGSKSKCDGSEDSTFGDNVRTTVLSVLGKP